VYWNGLATGAISIVPTNSAASILFSGSFMDYFSS
jgi:hypothetical protein